MKKFKVGQLVCVKQEYFEFENDSKYGLITKVVMAKDHEVQAVQLLGKENDGQDIKIITLLLDGGKSGEYFDDELEIVC